MKTLTQLESANGTQHKIANWVSILKRKQRPKIIAVIIEQGIDFSCRPISLQQMIWRWARKHEEKITAEITGPNRDRIRITIN